MLPGKKYKPEDFLRMAWNRKWFLIIPTVLVSAGTFLWTMTLPDRYAASTTILVVPQRVPESYVRPTVTASVAERLQTITARILARARLERLIEELNLYPVERQTMIMQDVVELMQRDIRVDIDRARRNEEATHFTVRYEGTDPRLTMRVADRLSQDFARENSDNRAMWADQTNDFLNSQLVDARRRLTETEGRLLAFQQQNAGQLPAQMQSNLQMLQMTQSQIQANNEAAIREQNELSVLEAAIADTVDGSNQPLGAPVAAVATPSAGQGRQQDVKTAAQALAEARAALVSLERDRRLKPTHPDVLLAKRVVADLEVRAAEEAARLGTGNGGGAPGATGAAPRANTKFADMRLKAEQLRRSLESRKSEDARLRKVVASYSSRIEIAPRLESQLTALTRDYETLRDQYQTLLKKSEESKLAVDLERRQIGEMFHIIDGARLPERPVSPDRVRYNILGLAGGLGLGVLLVGLLEYRDTTLKTDEDIVTTLALPVLAVIPAMVTVADRRRMKRRRLLLTAAASAVLVVGVGLVVWRLELLQAWVR